MLWIHGGAWAFGDRKQEADLAHAFASEGIAVAAISYRLSPALWADEKLDSGVQHPQHIKDVAQAFDFLYRQAENYGYDEEHIVVSGYSAGAHLSALLALDTSYLAEVGRTADDLLGVIAIAGTYDLQHYYQAHSNYRGEEFANQHVKGVFGENLEGASVTSWLANATVPIFVISESESYNYTRQFELAVKSKNVQHIHFHHLFAENHASLRADLAKKISARRGLVIDKILEFGGKG